MTDTEERATLLAHLEIEQHRRVTEYHPQPLAWTLWPLVLAEWEKSSCTCKQCRNNRKRGRRA